MRHDVEKYFERFGNVEKVQICSRNFSDFLFGFVQFKSADSAKAALAKKWHRIENRKIKVAAAKSQYQPDSEDYIGFHSDDSDDSDKYYGSDWSYN